MLTKSSTHCRKQIVSKYENFIINQQRFVHENFIIHQQRFMHGGHIDDHFEKKEDAHGIGPILHRENCVKIRCRLGLVDEHTRTRTHTGTGHREISRIYSPWTLTSHEWLCGNTSLLECLTFTGLIFSLSSLRRDRQRETS